MDDLTKKILDQAADEFMAYQKTLGGIDFQQTDEACKHFMAGYVRGSFGGWHPIETAPKDGTQIVTKGYLPEVGDYKREEKITISMYSEKLKRWLNQADGQRLFVPVFWKPI